MEYSIGIDSNVRIVCENKLTGQVIFDHKHNLANIKLLEGIVKLLSGYFNPTEYNPNNYNPEEGTTYIPVKIKFGNEGVVVNNHTITNYSSPASATVSNTELMSDFGLEFILSKSIPLISPAGNIKSLRLQSFLPAQDILGSSENIEDRPSYVFNKYGSPAVDYDKPRTIITESGLYSSDNTLLARVVFNNGDLDNTFNPESAESGHPLVLTDDMTLTVDWTINVASVSQYNGG